MKKIFDLDEAQIKVLHNVMEKNPDINTEVAALRFILQDYDMNKLQSAEIAKEVQELLSATINKKYDRMIKSIQATDYNCKILLDAMNTILFRMQVDHAVLTDAIESDVILESKNMLQKNIRKSKQRKDNLGQIPHAINDDINE